MIRAGDLRDRIALLRATQAANSFGEVEETWTETATCAAQHQSLLLKEATRMAGMSEAAEAKFLIRWRSGVDTGMRLRHGASLYGITSVEPQGHREALLLFVRRVG